MAKGRCGAYLGSVLLSFFVLLGMYFPIFTTPNLTAVASEHKSMVLHFIDVGQGDSTFIELPDGRNVLIDAGTSEYGEDVVKYISALGYNKIDCVVATHADSDHVGGLDEVLFAFEVQYIFRPFTIASDANPADDLLCLGLTEDQIGFNANIEYKEFIEATYKETYNGNNAIVKTISNKSICDVFMGINEPYFMMEILCPFARQDYEGFETHTGRTSGYLVENESLDSNDMSAVISIQTENSRVLLMADADEEVESTLIEKAKENNSLLTRISNVDVLKVAHHGSKNSTSADFLNIVKPKHAVISAGAGNSYNHPNEEVLDRLNHVSSSVYRTDVNGNIKIEINSSGELHVNFRSDEEKKSGLIPETVMYIIFAVIIVGIITTAIVYTARQKTKSVTK